MKKQVFFIGQRVVVVSSDCFNGLKGIVKEVVEKSNEVVVTLDDSSYDDYCKMIEATLAKQNLSQIIKVTPDRNIYFPQDEIRKGGSIELQKRVGRDWRA